MGPRGRNVLIQKLWCSKYHKERTGKEKEIELKDALENMGAQLVKEAASKTADQAGDGTTTATVLAHAIFKEALEKHHSWCKSYRSETVWTKRLKRLLLSLKQWQKR